MDDPLLKAQQRLQHLLGLSPGQAERAVSEVVDCLDLGVDDYIQARHAQLQAQGVANEEIYQRIAEELPGLRFRGPELSSRQIRRRVYG